MSTLMSKYVPVVLNKLVSLVSSICNKRNANIHRLKDVNDDDKTDGSTCSLMLLLIS